MEIIIIILIVGGGITLYLFDIKKKPSVKKQSKKTIKEVVEEKPISKSEFKKRVNKISKKK